MKFHGTLKVPLEFTATQILWNSLESQYPEQEFCAIPGFFSFMKIYDGIIENCIPIAFHAENQNEDR